MGKGSSFESGGQRIGVQSPRGMIKEEEVESQVTF